MALAGILLAACGSGASGSSSGAGSTSAPTTFQLTTPNPVGVTEQLDTAHAVSANIGPEGASLTATGGDGVGYTLTIPKDALIFDQRITLTPVAAIGGYPFHGGRLAAVHIQPDGLALLRPAVLDFNGVSAPAVGDRLQGTMHHAGGSDLHLYLLETRGVLRMHLLRFSTPAIAGASPQDISTQLQHPPQSIYEQIQQQVAADIARAHEDAVIGTGSKTTAELYSEIGAGLDAWEQQVIAKEVDVAAGDTSTWDQMYQAMTDLIRWQREWELIGGSDFEHPHYAGYLSQLVKQLPRIFRDQVALCFNNDDIRGALRAFALYRHNLITVNAPGMDLDPVERCLHFTVDFDTVESGWQLPSHYDDIELHVQAKQVPFGGVLQTPGGTTGPLLYASYSYQVNIPGLPCSFSSNTTVISDFVVFGINGLELDNTPGHQFELTDFFLRINPGQASETIHATCPHSGTTQTTRHDYNGMWELLHHVEQSGGGDISMESFAISGWQITNGGKPFATKTESQTLHPQPEYQSVSGTTLISVWHAPVGSP